MKKENDYTPAEQAMVDLWEEHTAHEFEDHSTEQTLATMTEAPVNINVPLMTGGVGLDEVRTYYSEHFIPKNPPDTRVELVTRTVGADRIVDEMILRFTHTTEMDWMLPGVPPTGRRVEIPTVGVVAFEGNKIASEHIYWDQASVLVQVGLLDGDSLPVVGAESVQKLLDPASIPSDLLIQRTKVG